MSIKAIDPVRLQSRRSLPGILSIGFSFGLSLGLGFGMGMETEARAAKINAASTDTTLKYPTYLNDQGNILAKSNVTHALATKDKSQAAFVAFKLAEGAAVSKSVPLMKTTSPVDSQARQAITAVSSGIGQIAVKTQRGLFLVNKYPNNPTFSAHKAVVRNKVAVNHQKVTTSHVVAKPTSAQHLTGAKTSSSTTLANLKKLFNLNAAKASLDSSPLGKLLKLNTPKATTTAKAENLAAPTSSGSTTPSTSTSNLTLVPAGVVQEAPVPEPSTIAFAALAIIGAALREGLKRRKAIKV